MTRLLDSVGSRSVLFFTVALSVALAFFSLPVASQDESIVSGMEIIDETPTSVRLWGWDFTNVDNKGYVLWGVRWRQSTIPVCWENPGDAVMGDLAAVRQAINDTWSANSCLRFTNWQQCQVGTEGIRVKIEEDGPHAKQLGQLLDGVPNGVVLNFTYKKWGTKCSSSEELRQLCNKSIAVHEWGHALGFAHEQNRWDTPAECLKKPQGPDGDVFLTSWDKDSVMNYCNPIYANDGVLSQGDIDSVHMAYCAPGESLKP